MTIIIPNLAFSGYKSFGRNLQYFEKFTKINIFIGQNNSGKSNILRLLSEIYPLLNKKGAITLDTLAKHLPECPPMLVGIAETVDSLKKRITASLDSKLHSQIHQACDELSDKSHTLWSFLTLPDKRPEISEWLDAIKAVQGDRIYMLWRTFTRMEGGNRKQDWEPDVIRNLQFPFPGIDSHTIPAIRQIGAKDTIPTGFDGIGIIERLAKLQNPDAHNQNIREQFLKIQQFLREVIDRPDARIEIPYERDTILIHMDNKTLPIESLGSGIHEVIIIAAAATILTNTVVCIEEPEIHLNPILQKKLINYIKNNTSNQYFLSTHSASLMDTPEAEVYHIRLSDGSSIVERVTSDQQRSSICEDLGYRPSDLLQANCIIWVEGPSDRLYLNWWLSHLEPSLIEGVHYSIMFYGGRLASHISFQDLNETINDFISLRRLNRRGVIIIDSDKKSPKAHINDTKKRLKIEFNSGPGHAWITEGREIENYLPPSQLKSAISNTSSKNPLAFSFGKYDNCLKTINSADPNYCLSKIKIAHDITNNNAPDFSILNIENELRKIIVFIRESNPTKTYSEK